MENVKQGSIEASKNTRKCKYSTVILSQLLNEENMEMFMNQLVRVIHRILTTVLCEFLSFEGNKQTCELPDYKINNPIF